MNFTRTVLVGLLIPTFCLGGVMPERHFECARTKNITRVSFDLLAPTAPTAVLVLVPGVNGDGGRFLEERAWRRFAEQHNWAIVGVTFVSPVELLKRNA